MAGSDAEHGERAVQLLASESAAAVGVPFGKERAHLRAQEGFARLHTVTIV